MKQAYPSEPLPLKRNYPQGIQPITWLMIILVPIFVLIACYFVFDFFEWSEYQPWQSIIGFFLASAFSLIMAFGMSSIQDDAKRLAWTKAFLANNADLQIDWWTHVVDISYDLRRTGDYVDSQTEPQQVAIYLAEALRAKIGGLAPPSSIHRKVLGLYLARAAIPPSHSNAC